MSLEISKTLIWFAQPLLNVTLIFITAFLLLNLWSLLKTWLQKNPFKWIFIDAKIITLVTCFAFLGYGIGLMIGLSQSPVVQVAIPAFMTFYGGFVTYLFAKDSFKDDETRYAIMFSVMAVSLFLMHGIEVGGVEKNRAITSRRKFDLHYFEREEAIKKRYR
jgi:hypothetical protein